MTINNKLTVMIGSTNPVKVQAVRVVFEKIYGEVEVCGVEVESGVGEQPMSEEETVRGAKNRARKVMRQTKEKVDYGVGIEGGVVEIRGKLFECAWVAVRNQKGKEGLGGGLYFELPPKVAAKIRRGGELGPIMNELTGVEDVKKKMGAIGILTRNKLNRQQAYEQIIWTAMVRFLSPKWYE